MSSTGTDYYYARHSRIVRVTHWINVIALTLLLMSGLQIFNAHPSLYWGKSSYSGEAPILEMHAVSQAGERIGVTRIFGREFETTGIFGLSRDTSGELVQRGFPTWATVPSDRWLAMARRWHFFFAWILVINGAVYLVHSIASRHFRRDLVPTKTDWRSIGRSTVDHLLLRHPRGEAAKHYNVLQKLSYLSVILLLLPLIILTGWAMSPWLNSVIPGWVDVFGGRQSARTLHFIIAWLVVLFVLIHVFEVIATGFWNNVRSMINGRYRVESDPPSP
jgi:thiosulfate reductase cytochrome b subunit